MKIALGTAQFGLDYGISNTSGKVSAEESARILETAALGGVRLVDTAPAYGDAERVLGDAGAAGRFAIVTKTAPLDSSGVAGVEAAFDRSLERLRADSAYGLLVHAPEDLLAEEGERLAALLRRLRETGRVRRAGVSAYSAAQLERALGVLDADLVQVPVSVFDQRLIADGTLARLKARGIEVHARSVFLQGLLLMEPEALPPRFEPIRNRVREWRAFCGRRGLSPLRAALGFVAGLPEVDHIVCGVETAGHLGEILAAAGPLDAAEFRALALDDPGFVDPRRWRVPA